MNSIFPLDVYETARSGVLFRHAPAPGFNERKTKTSDAVGGICFCCVINEQTVCVADNNAL